MSTYLDINVKHLTRVEGDGNSVVNIKEGILEKAQLEIVEAPRYFEAMLKGRSFHEAAIITSRICGICSLGHQITSLKTTEKALVVVYKGLPARRAYSSVNRQLASRVAHRIDT